MMDKKYPGCAIQVKTATNEINTNFIILSCPNIDWFMETVWFFSILYASTFPFGFWPLYTGKNGKCAGRSKRCFMLMMVVWGRNSGFEGFVDFSFCQKKFYIFMEIISGLAGWRRWTINKYDIPKDFFFFFFVWGLGFGGRGSVRCFEVLQITKMNEREDLTARLDFCSILRRSWLRLPIFGVSFWSST
ncbi:hypothetical protein QBC42DRAFT_58630 [Cladorrhinum samala]|uniref:Uncharacterized protein n=1 Tax=Cladorrhinum samala TaxID=585594 RepID=A0AAV9HXD3_9PEZI|nr:hypothetical protein QBC42DRAFT_58630 [Cladorrhinum samala]